MFISRRKRRKFTPEFRAEAVALCRAGDRTITKVAEDLDLTETSLREWVRRAEVRKTTDSRHGEPIAPNLLERDFEASAPDQT